MRRNPVHLLSFIASFGWIACYQPPKEADTSGLSVEEGEAPVVSLLGPDEEALLEPSAGLQILARIRDAETPNQLLDLRWEVDGIPALVSEEYYQDDLVWVSLEEGLTGGQHVIGLSATDPEGNSGSDLSVVTVADGAAPRLTWLAPVDEQHFPAGEDIFIHLMVADSDQDDLSLVHLSWHGDGLELEGASDWPDSSGDALWYLPAPEPGSYWLSVMAVDSDGLSTVDSVAFEVGGAEEVDLDGDGYASVESGGTDCDDRSDEIHPGRPETCDGVDEDCDGLVDEDAVGEGRWWRDEDGDLYGDPSESVTSCTQPDGYVDNQDDCDDEDAAVNPGAEELCDGDEVDEDCDGDVNDEDSDLGDGYFWYRDRDRDGAGDPDALLVACEQPSGYADNAWDCDDGDPEVSPDAVELCDGMDNDCDGAVDDDDSSLDGPLVYRDADGDGYGDGDRFTMSCSPVSGYVSNNEDCDDTDYFVSPEALEDCGTLIDDDCDGSTNDGGSIGCEVWYRDADGDDVPGTGLCICYPTSTFWSRDLQDCDDTDATISPEEPEVCGNGVDEDCSGADEVCI